MECFQYGALLYDLISFEILNEFPLETWKSYERSFEMNSDMSFVKARCCLTCVDGTKRCVNPLDGYEHRD